VLGWKLKFIGRRPEYEEVRDFILSKMPRGSVAAEIGVDQGNFSARILEIAKPTRLYLIDPWLTSEDASSARRSGNSPETDFQKVKQQFSEELRQGSVIIMRESSAAAVARLADSSLDWVYIDGDHQYEAVKHDLEHFFSKVKPGGFIVCDDYHYAGHWDDGVTKAVDEFMMRGLVKKIFQRRSQFVMRKR